MNSTFKNLIWYTIPFLFRNLIPLISLPFFTRYLSPFDFGNLALSVIYAVFLVALLNLGLIYVFERNYFEYEKDGEKLKLLWSCVIFVFINLGIGVIVTINYEEQINYYLFSKSLPTHLTVFATIHLGVKSLLQFFYIYLRNAKKAFIYSLLSIFEALICTLSSVYLVFYKKGILGYVQGQCVGVFVLFVAIILFSIFRRNIYFSFLLLKQNLSLSFPLTPRVFFGAINTQFDRYMLGVLNTRGGVGIYDIGQKIANFGFLSMTVMQHVFAPEVISTYVNKPKDFSKHVMPVDFVNRTGYGGVPGYTKPPDVKQRRRARDLSQTNMRKAAGHKTFEQLEEILRSKIMEKTKSGGLVLFRMFRKFDTNKQQSFL